MKKIKIPYKKPQFWLIVTAVVLVVATAITLPLCLIDRGSELAPYFADFDQKNDVSLQVCWEKLKKATSYEYQYTNIAPSVDGTKIVTGSTENTKVNLPRVKGEMYFRVRAVTKDGYTDYSDWITFTVDAWSLPKPETVSINSSTLEVTWTAVNYWDTQSKTNYSQIDTYLICYDIVQKGQEPDWSEEKQKNIRKEVKATSYNFLGYLKSYLYANNFVMVDGQEVWAGDLELWISIQACNYSIYWGTGIKQDKEGCLYQMYGEYGESATASLAISEEFYNALQ